MSQKTPSLIKMLANFAKASAEYIAAGMPSVTEEQYRKRVETCHECPNILKDTKQCGLCGCYIEQKASWQTAKCPDEPSRWDPIKLGDSGKPLNLKK
jgi:hypothetical protein